MSYWLYLLLFFSPVSLLAQNNKDTVEIRFSLPRIVKDTNDLVLELEVRNNSREAVLFYKELVYGYKFDGESNFSIESLVFSRGKFRFWPLAYIDKFHNYDDEGNVLDSIPFEYISLRPGEVRNYRLDIAQISGGLFKGRYKMQLALRLYPLEDRNKGILFYSPDAKRNNQFLETTFLDVKVIKDAFIRRTSVLLPASPANQITYRNKDAAIPSASNFPDLVSR